MIRLALCDDNKPFLEYESVIIERHLKEKNVDYLCDTFLSGEELLNNSIVIRNYDLIILDYGMDGLTGFETARKVYEIYPEAKIAFATNYYDFTREGYKYNAVRYLVKQEETFESELKECIDLFLQKEPKKTIILELNDGNIEVNIDDIMFVVSEKHYIRYFIKDRESKYYMRRCALDDIQAELPRNFVRVHQRYIVNLQYVVNIQKYELAVSMSNGEMKKIPIARSRYEEVDGEYCLIKGEI